MLPHLFNTLTARFTVAGILATFIASAGVYLTFNISLISAYGAALSLVSFAFCAYDKNQAIGGRLRVPERVFFILAFLGGALGIFLGMRLCRHKTQKASFQFYLILIVVTHLLILSLLGVGLK